MRPALCALFIVFAAPQVSAQLVSDSNRTVRVPFTDERAVRVPAVVDSPVLVELAGGEAIDDVIRGNPDQATWEVIKRGHRLFIRAMKGAAPTSLTAVTKSRSYIFDLAPVPASPENYNRRVARIVVELPMAPKAIAKPPTAESAPVAATEPVSAPRASARRNLEYSLQVVSETVDIRPREVFDDGRFTYFRFPNNLEIPTIYRSVPDAKEEWLVNSHREGDFVVMQAVAPLWTMRLAGSVLGVFNDAFDAEGVAPLSGTTTPALARTLRK